MNISDIIKAIRQENDLSQAQLAQKLRVTQAAVSNWELGLKLPNYENLKTICVVFDLPPDYILGFSDYGMESISGKTKYESTLIEYYRNLSDDDKELIMQACNKKK